SPTATSSTRMSSPFFSATVRIAATKSDTGSKAITGRSVRADASHAYGPTLAPTSNAAPGASSSRIVNQQARLVASYPARPSLSRRRGTYRWLGRSISRNDRPRPSRTGRARRYARRSTAGPGLGEAARPAPIARKLATNDLPGWSGTTSAAPYLDTAASSLPRTYSSYSGTTPRSIHSRADITDSKAVPLATRGGGDPRSMKKMGTTRRLASRAEPSSSMQPASSASLSCRASTTTTSPSPPEIFPDTDSRSRSSHGQGAICKPSDAFLSNVSPSKSANSSAPVGSPRI